MFAVLHLRLPPHHDDLHEAELLRVLRKRRAHVGRQQLEQQLQFVQWRRLRQNNKVVQVESAVCPLYQSNFENRVVLSS